MANTGHDWATAWTVIDAAVALTQGATITDESAEQEMDIKSSCLISFDVDYSNHAKATAGLSITIKRDVDDTVYESANGAAMTFEMPFTQNGTERKVIQLFGDGFHKFVITLDWGNTTASSVATTATAIKFSDIPVAS